MDPKKKKASAKRKIEILDYKFRHRLCTKERKGMKEGKKHLAMLIGDRGTGVGSTVKGHCRYGGTWKQKIHVCVSIRNNKNVQTRDSVSAMAIGLSGLATVLFNQTFPQFATIISQSNTEFKHNTNTFLTRSGFRARGDAS
ncbi:hypothetical protein EDC94DRAFT_673774 [Helicostylum pulchrum]|nr:hypothetical protein EDC94DRAFT_673774 [Helicostylum pulchrum]